MKLRRYRIASEDPTPTTLEHEIYDALSKHPVLDVQYGLDKVEIVSKVPANILHERFAALGPTNSLIQRKPKILLLSEENEKKNNKRYKYGEALQKGYHSIFRVVHPSESFIEFLIQNKNLFGKTFLIWHLEIFKDLIVDSVKDALLLHEYYVQTTYRGQQRKGKISENLRDLYEDYVRLKKSEDWIPDGPYLRWFRQPDFSVYEQKRVFSTKTLYLGDGDARFVIYARHSKTSLPKEKKPCVHMEWRIQWSPTYKWFNLIGISKKNKGYLESLKNLTALKAAETFEMLNRDRIFHAEIDKIKLGKHYNGWTNEKKFTRGHAFQLAETINLVIEKNNIENTSKFIKFCRRVGLDQRRFLVDVHLM